MKLLALVACLGLAYSAYQASGMAPPPPAELCRANRNLIDSMIGIWESRNVDLVPGLEPFWIEIENDGDVGTMSESVVSQMAGARDPLRRGGNQLAYLTRDPLVFICPDQLSSFWWFTARGPGQGRYRWMSSKVGLRDLGGGSRGVVCPVHGGGI